MHLLKEVEPLPCLVLVIYEGLLTATRRRRRRQRKLETGGKMENQSERGRKS
jgi:hypothetical protein